ncbi:serine/threonine-protein kinase [Actinoplanes sp. NPDC026619]|uniref:serine/threonine-protein kinase n=1 Tax=Actinoplanes sp. NPDC026619 TaxID=3155798 RepID=UPI0034018F58
MGRKGQAAPRRIAGRYRLLEKLGTGGMSEIWRGYDETLGRPVAVKVLSPRLADDQSFRDRLRQEALAAARLSHPHITGIFDFGESPLYVVMELNDGESVAARLNRRGAMPWREAVTVAVEVASALATAHARGIVHRDVTPANVMLTGAGAKVVDFGISAIVGERDAAPDGSLLGTPAYLAPERLGGAQVSAAADVYALGLLLYRSLTGRLPWPAETTAEALRAHLYADPEPLPALPDMPPEVGTLCLSFLAKTPGDRPDAVGAARALAATVGIKPSLPPLRERLDDAPPPVRAVASAGSAPVGASGFGVRRLRESVSLLRLRVGLKVGSRLRVGAVRPLGGGLFAGGGATRSVLTGRALFAGRHRVQAALVTASLLGAAGVGWAATRESPKVEQAQAAGAVPAAVAPKDDACAVRYQLKRDSGREYEALLTVATTDEVGRGQWRVVFAYPGSQRLTGSPKAVVQKGRKVTAKGRGALRTFTLRGDYRGYNPLPLTFTMDGRRCRAEVLGGTTQEVSEASGAAASATTKRNRPPSKSGTPRKRVNRPQPSTPSPASSTPSLPPPMTRKGSGFSLAL